MIVGMGIGTVAGCTAPPAPSHDWSDRMIALLRDPKGQGGAGGGLEVGSGAKSARGSVELAGVPNGEYDLLAVCTGTGVVLEATNTSTSAQWQAAMVTPGWEPTRTNYSD